MYGNKQAVRILLECILVAFIFAGCHRYDQSAISILLDNTYNYTMVTYMVEDNNRDFPILYLKLD